MKAIIHVVSIAIVAIAFPFVEANGQDHVSEQRPTSLDQMADRIVERERQLEELLAKYSPRVETYIQIYRQNRKTGPVTVDDDYFLGRLEVRNGVVEHAFLPRPEKKGRSLSTVLPLGPIVRLFSFQLEPNVFATPILLDITRFNREHYQFRFVRREFLGEVRCLVFDLWPRADAGEGGLFQGRIWVEDQDDYIVRFNGSFGAQSRFTYHFDSWRQNLQPRLWLPVYIYSEESSLIDSGRPDLGFKAQTRLWGYELKDTSREEELTRILVEAPPQAPAPVQDGSEAAPDTSPRASERAWQLEAEANILERLEQARLLAPVGAVDKVLEVVVNNLIATNGLDNLPPIHCRVLLTYPLESLPIGNTILVSRGLIDVLPDEASLALVLAHELSHVILGHPVDTKYAFYDRMATPDENLLRSFDLTRTKDDEAAADVKALELLKNSPYKDKLGNAGLFLRALADEAPHIPRLLGAHLGNRMIERLHQVSLSELMASAPKLEWDRLDQIAALPLGARIKIDPWNDRVELLKPKPVALISPREKMPFKVTPMIPFLTRFSGSATEEAHR
ncbi:MAG TPA: M48 family metalloprotease [Terriglobia bacterium]|nr:M48 family metalloprotease [Terriglobia bacterium]